MADTTTTEVEPAAQGPQPPPEEHPTAEQPTRRRRMAPHLLSLVVLVVGLLATGALTWASRANYVRNEHRLTVLQAELTGAALAAAPADIERRLGPAVSATAASGGKVSEFIKAITPSIGKSGPFAYAALFKLVGGHAVLVTSMGTNPLLAPGSPQATAICRRAAQSGTLDLAHLVVPGAQRFGYALAATGGSGTYVGYAEQALAASRQVSVAPSSAAYDLRFAIYYGRTTSASALVVANVRQVPLRGTTATTTVPFGDSVLTLVVSPRGSLSGTFAADVAWGIAIVGFLLTLGAALMVERLVRRRMAAEALATENRRLYQSQRTVAEVLQHSLLPQQLPHPPGLDIAVRYLPGTAGIEVGGDWYDVVTVDERHVFFAVGDVAGRGLEAATLMSRLRNAMNAYALDGDAPDVVASKITRLVDVARDGRFATVVCGRLDTSTGDLTLANAGHISPVLLRNEQCELVDTPHDPPVGVGREYTPTRLTLAPGATLLLVTDGLVERRGESISAGIQRLCRAAEASLPLEELLDRVLDTLVPSGPTDDIALLGLRWQG